MFGCRCSVLALLLVLVAPQALAGTVKKQGDGEPVYAGGDAPGGRQGRPITVVGGTQAAGDGRVGGGDASPGRPGTPGAGINLGGVRLAPGEGSTTGAFGSGRGPAGPAVPAVDGGRFGPGGLRDPAAALGGGRFGGSGSGSGGRQGTRVVEAQTNPTVTKTITIDHYLTLTDTALNTVAVTLTDFTVRTKTVQTVQVARTPVDDRVALRTEVVLQPETLTVTYIKSYFRIDTEVPTSTVTITHSAYVIKQTTVTTTAIQVLTYTSTSVQTVVHTHRQVRTAYHTFTDTPALGYYPY